MNYNNDDDIYIDDDVLFRNFKFKLQITEEQKKIQLKLET